MQRLIGTGLLGQFFLAGIQVLFHSGGVELFQRLVFRPLLRKVFLQCLDPLFEFGHLFLQLVGAVVQFAVELLDSLVGRGLAGQFGNGFQLLADRGLL